MVGDGKALLVGDEVFNTADFYLTRYPAYDVTGRVHPRRGSELDRRASPGGDGEPFPAGGP